MLSYDTGYAVRVSPDGRFAAFASRPREGDASSAGVFLFDMDEESDLKRVFNQLAFPIAWTGDGRSLFLLKGKRSSDNSGNYEVWRVNADGAMPTQLPFPATDTPRDVSPDGKRVLVAARSGLAARDAPRKMLPPLEVVSLDGKERTRIIDAEDLGGLRGVPSSTWRQRFTPDGQRVVYARIDPKTEQVSIWSVSIRGEDRKCLIPATDEDRPDTFCVAPDGESLAVVYSKRNPPEEGQQPTRSSRLSIIGIDGKNRREMRELPPPDYSVIDWQAH